MLSQLGFLVSGNSELGTDFLDRLTENYNYLNAIEYDPNTGDLTLLADQVTALRKELKDRYYNLIGLKTVNSSNLSNLINDTKFRSMFDNIEYYNDVISRISDYKCALTYGSSSHYYRVIFLKMIFVMIICFLIQIIVKAFGLVIHYIIIILFVYMQTIVLQIIK